MNYFTLHKSRSVNQSMKTKLALLLSLLSATLCIAQSSTSAPLIIVDDASQAIFPEVWRTSTVSASAEPLYQADQQECIEIVEKALAKYPSAIVKANLKKVYVLGRLEYSGVVTGGTNSRSAVYIVKNDRFSAEALERNFHAEFSSILLRNFPRNLDKAEWEQLNPSGFSYRSSGVQAIKDKQASLRLLDDLHEQGFLHEYAKASMEEDFNSYAARLFMGDAGLWKAVENHRKVRSKAELTVAFYEKLAASMNKEWFYNLRQSETK